MNRIVYYPLSVVTNTSVSTQVPVNKWDQLLLYVPMLSTVAGSGTITATLKVAYSETASTVTQYYYDYVNAAPAECKITMATAGMYELPNAGSGNSFQIKFDVAMTQATSFYLVAPKTTW